MKEFEEYERSKKFFPPEDADENKINTLTPLQAFALFSVAWYTTDNTNRYLPTVKELHGALEGYEKVLGTKKATSKTVLEVTLRDLKNWDWPLLLAGPDVDRPLENDAQTFRLHPMTIHYPMQALIVLAVYKWQRAEPYPVTYARLKKEVRLITTHLVTDEESGEKAYKEAMSELGMAILCHYLKVEQHDPISDETTLISYLPRTHGEIRYIRLLLPDMLKEPFSISEPNG